MHGNKPELVSEGWNDSVIASAAAQGEVVLIVTISNGCPVPGQCNETG